MAGKGNEETKPEDLAKQAAAAGSDLSQGSQSAYSAMMQVVSDAQVKYGNNTPGMDKFNKGLVSGLERSGAMEEMAEQFAVRNLDTVAHGDGKNARYPDFNPQFGNNALEQAFLTSLRNNYGDLQARAGHRAFGGAKEEFGEKEFGKVLDSRQGERDQAEQARLAQESQAREQRKLQDVAGKLFSNDGNPKHSLYSMLDGIQRSGKNDGDISKGDLEKYRERYAEEAAKPHAEVNGWTKDNFETVKTLLNEWDKPLGVALRGTHVDNNNSGHGNGRNERVPNYYINMEAAGESLGLNGKDKGADIYEAYAPPGDSDRSSVRQVSATSDDLRSESPPPIPRGASAADAVNSTAATDSRTATTGSAGDTQFDAQGNPINSTAARTDSTAARTDNTAGSGSGSAPIRRDLDASGRPVTDGSGGTVTDSSGAPVRSSSGNGDGYDQYYERQGATPRARATASGERTSAAGSGERTNAAATNDAAAAPARRADAVADIEHAPALAMPEFKAGDDLTKVAQDYQKAALDHFTASAIYTVKPGQGWDRIARDTMRKSGQDINERDVLAMSDQVAKLNGLGGRLDGSRMLHPGDQVQVRDAAWIKTQVDAAMAEFQKKVTDQTAASTATTSDAPEGTDLYSGARNGEGDVSTPAATTGTTGATDSTRTTTSSTAATDSTQATTTPAATDSTRTTTSSSAATDSTQTTTTPAATDSTQTTTTPAATDSTQNRTTTGAVDSTATSATGAIDVNAATATTPLDKAEQDRQRAALAAAQQRQQAESDGSDIYGLPPSLG